jgi:hypothetical protein
VTAAPTPQEPNDDVEVRHRRRLDLVWATALFQVKLLADGVRDLFLVPVSIAATILGLVGGGDEPDRYFRQVLRLGRRTDAWINLFGQHRRGPTADRFAAPLQQTLENEFERDGWVRRHADRFNTLLDAANERAKRHGAADDPSPPRDPVDDDREPRPK